MALGKNVIHHKTAIFRQVNLDCPHAHHDALEFPDGDMVLLTYLMERTGGDRSSATGDCGWV